MNEKLKIGVSHCLLGERVRYDGQHQLDRFIVNTLGQYVEFVPVCPEVECGLPVPREAMRLVGDSAAPRLLTRKTEVDHTQRMQQWANQRVRDLEKKDLCGFIFKGKSPSSGMERVKVYGDDGMVQKIGVGLFARAFMEHFPRIPVEEDGRLHDVGLRENFIIRIFTLKRWREVMQEKKTPGNLVAFHTRHKLLLMSHSPKHYREMGKWVADVKSKPAEQQYDQYEVLLLEALQLKNTIKKHVNVLQHMMGYFKKDLSPDEKRELLEIIGQYKDSLVPLIVPLTLINHYVRKYNQAYLREQIYLHPHPQELKLRNHV